MDSSSTCHTDCNDHSNGATLTIPLTVEMESVLPDVASLDEEVKLEEMETENIDGEAGNIDNVINIYISPKDIGEFVIKEEPDENSDDAGETGNRSADSSDDKSQMESEPMNLDSQVIIQVKGVKSDSEIETSDHVSSYPCYEQGCSAKFTSLEDWTKHLTDHYLKKTPTDNESIPRCSKQEDTEDSDNNTEDVDEHDECRIQPASVLSRTQEVLSCNDKDMIHKPVNSRCSIDSAKEKISLPNFNMLLCGNDENHNSDHCIDDFNDSDEEINVPKLAILLKNADKNSNCSRHTNKINHCIDNFSDSDEEIAVPKLPNIDILSESVEETVIPKLPNIDLLRDSVEAVIHKLPNIDHLRDSVEETVIPKLPNIDHLRDSVEAVIPKLPNIDLFNESDAKYTYKEKRTELILLQCSQCSAQYKLRIRVHGLHYDKFLAEGAPIFCSNCSCNCTVSCEIITDPLLEPYKDLTPPVIACNDIACIDRKNKFTSLKRLGDHEWLYHRERSIICSTCGIQCKSADELSKHIYDDHPGESKDSKFTHKCEACDLIFPNYRRLHYHKTHKHGEKYPCNICGKIFSDRASVQKHVRCLHESTEVIALKKARLKCLCNICGISLSDKYSLKRHIQDCHEPKHSKEKCEVCGKEFLSQKGYVGHMRAHKVDNTCKICGKHLTTVKGLKEHQLVHDHSRTVYPCNGCSKSFVSKGGLKYHQKTSICGTKSGNLDDGDNDKV